MLSVGALAATAGAGVAWWRLQPAASQAKDVQAFWQKSFDDLNGSPVTMASLRGRPLLVNFWATSCSTCIAEMPDMVETYKKYQANGLELVAVAMSYDPPNYVLNYAETRQLPFKVALDTDGSAAKSFGDVKLTPTTFLIDKDGKLTLAGLLKRLFEAQQATRTEALAGIFDEADPAVLWMIRTVIEKAHAKGRKVGLCGQRPSNDPAFARLLVEAGIDSISVTPDSFLAVKRSV